MRQKSVLYAWAFSYAALLLLMVALCGVLGYRAQGQLVNEYKSITRTLQQRTGEELQKYLDDMAQCSYEIANNYVVYSFVSNPSPTKTSYYNLNYIQDALKVYALNRDKNVSRYLYMNNLGRTLTSETILDKDGLYSQLSADISLSPDDFEALLAQYHYNDIQILRGNNATKLIMLSSVPLTKKLPCATLLQTLDADELGQLVTASSAVEGSTSVLLDRDGQVVCAVGDKTLAARLPAVDAASAVHSELSIGGEDYWYQYETLDAQGWTLLTVLPMREIRERSMWIVRQSIPWIVGMILAGSAMCGAFLYLNYRPLNTLRKSMAGAGGSGDGNEYAQLAAAFGGAQNSLAQMQALWDTQTRQLRQEFLRSCVEGDVVYDEKRLRQILEHLDAGFAGEWFCVALLRDADGTALDEQGFETLYEKLPRALDGCPDCRIDVLPQEEHSLLLLNAGSESTAAAAMAQLQTALRTQGVESALSPPCQKFENIHLAYLKACEAEHDHEDGTLGLLAAAAPTPTGTKNEVPRLSPEQKELLLRYIVAGNTAEAETQMSLILQNNWVEQVLPVSICRCLAYDILCGILQSVGCLQPVWDDQKDALRADLHALRHYTEREDIAALLRASVQRTTVACAAKRAATSEKEQPLDRVVQCVNEHYRELDFNVSKAAELLGMNMAYVSKLFKQQTGIGLLNYISGLRVKYAKQCILERHISVAEAAKEAGFENINTFIRIFKKYEGTTPGNISSFPGENQRT